MTNGSRNMKILQTDPQDKGKDKTDTQTQYSTETPLPRDKRKPSQQVPSEAQMTKDGEEGTLEAQKRKKQKATKIPLNTTLIDDDYEQIPARLKDEMGDTFQAMQASQGKLQGAIDQYLVDLKTLTEKTSTIHTQLSKTPAGESST